MILKGPHIIIGLGNPGAEFQGTRHNAGFDVIDAFAEELGVRYWKTVSNAMVGEAMLQGEKILLVKPQSYMNLSGGPIKGLAGRYGFTAEDILVIHDELDLPTGTIRLKFGGGHAGHRGLNSMHLSLGSDYARLRIGIGRPPGRMPAHSYVLQRMREQVLEEFKVTIARAVPIVRMVIEEGLRAAMNEYNVTERESTQPDTDQSQEQAEMRQADVEMGQADVEMGQDNMGLDDIGLDQVLADIGQDDIGLDQVLADMEQADMSQGFAQDQAETGQLQSQADMEQDYSQADTDQNQSQGWKARIRPI